jgi:hypothetical protein
VIFLFAAVILLVGAMALLQLAGSSNAVIGVLYGYLVSSPQDIMANFGQIAFTAPSLIFRNGYGLVYSAYQLASNINTHLAYWGFALLVSYLFLVLYIRLSKNRGKAFNSEGIRALGLTNMMVAAAVILFVFSQNSPFGWYYIPYPMAIAVYTDRLYFELSLIMIYVEAAPLYLMYLYIRKKLVNSNPKIKKGSNRALVQGGEKHMKLRKVGTATIVMVIIASITVPALSNYGGYVLNRGQSVITQDDLDAFSWIQANTPSNTTFFANYNDAGGFVYIYTGRIVLSPYALRARPVYSSAVAFDNAEAMLQVGYITQELIQVLRGYNVSYVYVGERVQYDGPRFNTIALIQSPYLEIVFHEGGAYIFRINMP